jgi:hypothetical protein
MHACIATTGGSKSALIYNMYNVDSAHGGSILEMIEARGGGENVYN